MELNALLPPRCGSLITLLFVAGPSANRYLDCGASNKFTGFDLAKQIVLHMKVHTPPGTVRCGGHSCYGDWSRVLQRLANDAALITDGNLPDDRYVSRRVRAAHTVSFGPIAPHDTH